MIYVDVENINDYACYVVTNSDTIRAYRTMPTRPSTTGYQNTVNYRDFYVNSHYMYLDGTQSFGYNSTLPICLDKSIITNDFYYRNDFSEILIIFLILCIFCFYLPLKIFSKLFKRGSL